MFAAHTSARHHGHAVHGPKGSAGLADRLLAALVRAVGLGKAVGAKHKDRVVASDHTDFLWPA